MELFDLSYVHVGMTTPDETALKLLTEARNTLGPDKLEVLLGLGNSLPAEWRDWHPKRCLEYLRCRFEFTQAGLAQSLVSRIEGGAEALLSTWAKLFNAMGFDLVLLPISSMTIEALEQRAEAGRPPGHRIKRRARPRRRWAAHYAQRRKAKEVARTSREP